MSNSEKRMFEGWKGPLLPYRDFHKFYSDGFTWTPREDFTYIVPVSLQVRFKIVVERSSSDEPGISGNRMYFDCGRSDTLRENGIWDSELDAIDLADQLFETLFQHCNEIQMKAVSDRLLAYIKERDKLREEYFK